MAIDATDTPNLVPLLSRERLAALVQLTGSDQAAVELHQETLRVGAALMTVIAGVEIALRNAVCDNLTAYLGVSNWLTQPPLNHRWRAPEESKVRMAIDSAKRALYAKLNQQQKAALDQQAYPNGRPAGVSHARRAKDRRRTLQLTEGRVVAELTLYFWKRLYGPDYERGLWETTLKRTFPNRRISRAEVAKNLEAIYQARNRLAHHEPVLHKRFNDTLEAVRFVTQNLGCPRPTADTSLTKMLAEDVAAAQRQAQSLHAKLATYRNNAP